MEHYYFLASLLPDLRIGQVPELPFGEFVTSCRESLTEQDLDQVRVIRRYMDIHNLRAFWMAKELDIHGNYNHKELEEILLIEDQFPSYVFDFLSEYETIDDRLEHFSKLVALFFQHEIEVAEGFLKDYLVFEREIRLVMVGFRAKLIKKDIVRELQYEDPTDTLVAQIIAQKDAENYEPPIEYEVLKGIFHDLKEEPLKLHEEIAKYRFRAFGEMMQSDVFKIDHILAYLAQLILVDRWWNQDQEKGKDIVDTILKIEG